MNRLSPLFESTQVCCGTKKEQLIENGAISSQHDPVEFSPGRSCSILGWRDKVISSMGIACIDDMGCGLGSNPITTAEANRISSSLAITNFPLQIKNIVP